MLLSTLHMREESGTRQQKAVAPAILYLNISGQSSLHVRRLDGIRRYAKTLGWDVATLEWEITNRKSVRGLIAEQRPVGCIMECWAAEHALPPQFFGKMPVVYFDPPDKPDWRGATTVDCDNAAIAEAAFHELSSGRPAAYAAVSCFSGEVFRWPNERLNAFVERCRSVGRECPVFSFPAQQQREQRECAARLAKWAAALPPHCAIFAVNDWSAELAARALAAAGRVLPRDATLIGADDSAAKTEPPGSQISSIRIDFEMSGYLAAKTVAGKISHRGTEARRSTCDKSIPTYGPLFVERRESTRGRGRREPYVLPALEIIRREACDGLTASRLAARFPGSRKHFERRFREAMGHSVLNEILLVRLQRVGELLSKTDKPISAICDFCGFNSNIALHKLFRSRTGMSMRDWRKKHRI